MKKEIVTIRLDYLQGPICLTDLNTGYPITGIDIVDNDDILAKINYEISNLYNSYYEFNSHNQPCWFNEKKRKRIRIKCYFFCINLLIG